MDIIRNRRGFSPLFSVDWPEKKNMPSVSPDGKIYMVSSVPPMKYRTEFECPVIFFFKWIWLRATNNISSLLHMLFFPVNQLVRHFWGFSRKGIYCQFYFLKSTRTLKFTHTALPFTQKNCSRQSHQTQS